MRRAALQWLAVLALATPSVLCARTSGELQITERTLNAVVEKIGAQSDSGVHQIVIDVASDGYTMCDSLGPLLCPPYGPALPEGPAPSDVIACWDVGGGINFFPSDTVTWRWWIGAAHFTIKKDAMTFTATVGSDVGGHVAFTRKTVPATVRLSESGGRLEIAIEDFEVRIVAEGRARPIRIVDLDALYGVALTFDALDFDVPATAGTPGKTVTAAIRPVAESESGVIVEYEEGYVVVKLDVGFTEAQ